MRGITSTLLTRFFHCKFKRLAFLALFTILTLQSTAFELQAEPIANNASQNSDSVSAFDAVIATVAVGDYPVGVAVNPAGTRVYVADRGSSSSGSVSVIDTASATPTTSTTSTSSFEGTYSTTGLTIHLAQSSSTLSGTFSTGSLSGNLGGFVDSSGRAYTWVWFDSSTAGSAILAGSLSLSGSQGTFSFGGGRSSGGRISNFDLSGMTKTALSGSTTPTSTSASTANFAGTYTTTGLTITLTQSGTTLSGTFTAGSLSGTMGGFVADNGSAYIYVRYDTSGASGVLAGSLSLTGTNASFNFGGGQSSGGIISEVALSGLTLATSSTRVQGGTCTTGETPGPSATALYPTSPTYFGYCVCGSGRWSCVDRP